jgi:ketosteroid isomerase-like protein
MGTDQANEEIKRVAMNFDNAIEMRDSDLMAECFAEDCEIELMGLTLKGKDGVKRWMDWLFEHVTEIKLIPRVIMVQNNTFFEEFIVKAKLHNGRSITSKQSEVLIYENYKIKNLRLYFDRLDFADAAADGVISKKIINTLIEKSTKGLRQ